MVKDDTSPTTGFTSNNGVGFYCLRFIPVTVFGTSRIQQVVNSHWRVYTRVNRNYGGGEGGTHDTDQVDTHKEDLEMAEGESVDFLTELLELSGWPQVNTEETKTELSW
jgi:hypothetical protein